MPSWEQEITDNIRSLQRQLDQIVSARPGPMSWGPRDGHVRFYAADGRVLFQANSAGASVESRGALTGLTPLLDSIRAKDDAQDTRMTDERADRIAVDNQLEGLIVTERTERRDVDAQLSTQISTNRTDRIAVDNSLAQQIADEVSARQSADSGLSSRITTAQNRADDAHSDAATAQSRADSAHSRIDGLDYATPAELNNLASAVQTLAGKVATIEQWLTDNLNYPMPMQ